MFSLVSVEIGESYVRTQCVHAVRARCTIFDPMKPIDNLLDAAPFRALSSVLRQGAGSISLIVELESA